ncbi:cytochrome c biogenesis protein CcsA [Blastococcus brunescens]|uniref:Cytochrome c biogenesis protein CcsA n=1 Tax=Blastococcus brunescens TaxID=1564165 RepID=A0ABZ1B8P2_9ACTN|nr:cytochrome c biogenesis protein CcsA [Blastococcus sp. BMG 8361]WRL67160.1 cytochrome c biogenesis protein CcsA [Blastococcus sp. BMG 8361]
MAGHPRQHGRHRLRRLLRQRHRQRDLPGADPARGAGRRGEEPGGLLARLPGAAALDRVAHRTAVFGFPIWTFTVIAGAIWAEAAWGRFWGWDPKETWAFIAWVVYAAYLHARTTAGWRGKPAAWVNVVGLGVMIFNLTFVNMVSTGLHSYAGVN